MGFATLDDRTGRLEIAAFSETYEKHRDIFYRDNLLIAEGSLGVDDYLGTLRLTIEKLYSMEQAREAFARSVQLNWNAATTEQGSREFISKLNAVLKPFRGGACPISLIYTSEKAQTTLQMGDEWRVHPTDELISRLRWLLGANAVVIKYK
jgi:DNA polymerase-3 subunit alpha